LQFCGKTNKIWGVKKIFLTISLLAYLTVTPVAHALVTEPDPYIYGFTFQSATPDYGGEFFFDSPANSEGNLSDVGYDSYITTPDGTFTLGDSYTYQGGNNLSDNGVTISWGADGITSMDITDTQAFYIGETGSVFEWDQFNWFATANEVGDDGGTYEYFTLGTGSVPTGGDPSASGYWTPAFSTPEATDTMTLLGLAATSLVGFHTLLRWRL
jgi:hypothetical protein